MDKSLVAEKKNPSNSWSLILCCSEWILAYFMEKKTSLFENMETLTRFAEIPLIFQNQTLPNSPGICVSTCAVLRQPCDVMLVLPTPRVKHCWHGRTKDLIEQTISPDLFPYNWILTTQYALCLEPANLITGNTCRCLSFRKLKY